MKYKVLAGFLLLAIPVQVFAISPAASSSPGGSKRELTEVVGAKSRGAVDPSSYGALKDSLPTVRFGEDLGPIRAELAGPDSGMLIFRGAAGELSAFPTSRGELCIVATTSSRTVGGTCIGDLGSDGIGAMSFSEQNGNHIFGLVDHRVESVEVVDKEGREAVLRPDNGAIVWTGLATPVGLKAAWADGSESYEHVFVTEGN